MWAMLSCGLQSSADCEEEKKLSESIHCFLLCDCPHNASGSFKLPLMSLPRRTRQHLSSSNCEPSKPFAFVGFVVVIAVVVVLVTSRQVSTLDLRLTRGLVLVPLSAQYL